MKKYILSIFIVIIIVAGAVAYYTSNSTPDDLVQIQIDKNRYTFDDRAVQYTIENNSDVAIAYPTSCFSNIDVCKFDGDSCEIYYKEQKNPEATCFGIGYLSLEPGEKIEGSWSFIESTMFEAADVGEYRFVLNYTTTDSSTIEQLEGSAKSKVFKLVK